jgi:hypothetical protein
MYMCEKCEKNFTTKQNLKVHGKSCKGHKIITSHKCDFCGKMLSTKHKLNCHLDTCKKRKEKHDIDLKAEIKELKEAIKEIANKPQTIINNNLTIVNKLISYGCEPLDLSLERFNELATINYTYETLSKCRIFKDLIKPYYSNSDGKVCALLADKERMKIKAIDKNFNVVTQDPEFIVTNLFKKSDVVKERTKMYIDNTSFENYSLIQKANNCINDHIKLRKHKKNSKSVFLYKIQPEPEPEIQIRFIED